MFYLFWFFNLSAVPLKTFSGHVLSVPAFCFSYSMFISEIAHLRLLSLCYSDSHQRCEWRSWGRDGSQVNWHLIWDICPLEPLFKAMSVKYYMCHNCIVDFFGWSSNKTHYCWDWFTGHRQEDGEQRRWGSKLEKWDNLFSFVTAWCHFLFNLVVLCLLERFLFFWFPDCFPCFLLATNVSVYPPPACLLVSWSCSQLVPFWFALINYHPFGSLIFLCYKYFAWTFIRRILLLPCRGINCFFSPFKLIIVSFATCLPICFFLMSVNWHIQLVLKPIHRLIQIS